VEADNDVAQTAAAREMLPAAPLEYVLFYRQQYRLLMAYAMHAGAKADEADGLTADTLASMLPRWDSIEVPAAWARDRLIRNLLNLRKSETARRIRQGKYVASQYLPPHNQDDVWADPHAVDDLLGILTDNQRTIVRHLISGLTQHEIAELLGRSYASVRRALSDIRRRLEQQHPHKVGKARMSTRTAVRKEAR
jgi:RNA polymerase sigma factor (sigma-70 family)